MGKTRYFVQLGLSQSQQMTEYTPEKLTLSTDVLFLMTKIKNGCRGFEVACRDKQVTVFFI